MQRLDQDGDGRISGLIERVTFHNEENGFFVLKATVKGRHEPVTVTGSLPSVNVGEWLDAEGRWVRDRKYGLQFQAKEVRCAAPSSREGIERYLGSGMIKGIGPAYAKKLVDRFGDQVLEIIERQSARLEEVEGIGAQRRRRIKDAWNEQKVVRDIMVFLHSHGVSTSRAVRIYKTYGEEAVEKVRANPYRLAIDIRGIGFHTADRIASRIGVAHDSGQRAEAGLNHVLGEATSQGHCALPREDAVAAAKKLLEIGEDPILLALDEALRKGGIGRVTISGTECICLPALNLAEEGVAAILARLSRQAPEHPAIDVAKAVAWVEKKTGTRLAESQRAALERALVSRLTIVTGGPGVGKTTLVNSILKILRAKGVRCLLCAPTGRAAKRMAESTGLEAKTIHRLLEFQPGKGFARREQNPLECDLLVVDEASMIDVLLMHQLLRALPSQGHLLLVGDVDQLPSVGPGAVLKDLIASERIPVATLNEVFRQAAHSRIVTNAHRINEGFLPKPSPEGDACDFYFIERNDPAGIQSTLLKVIRERIPQRFGLDPVRDVQVLCPMNRGNLGVRELNLRLQELLNPGGEVESGVEKFGWIYRPGDKVIQTVNNYDKDVFNGDVGTISFVGPEEREVRVQFDGRTIPYEFGELDELSLAYAMTIHKSQGSEFPAVVIPLHMQQYLLLQRNLIYTGLTRGRKLVVLIGQHKALAAAVKNDRTRRRWSCLRERLQNLTQTA